MKFFGSKEIKLVIKKILDAKQDQFAAGALVLDLPSGSGYSLQILKDMGARVTGADLFPELSRVEGVPVVKAVLGETLPFEDASFDLALCQEGIEHIGNQNQVFDEFSRVLRMGGHLLVTTPNYSNLRARLSYLLTESELYGKLMPPNLHDSIWLSEANDERIYFGHVFLTGIQRLLLFARLSGFELVQHHPTRVNYSALMVFLFLYPFILLFSLKTYFRFLRKGGSRDIARESLRWMISPRVLIEGHLCLEFKKVRTAQEVQQQLRSNRLQDLTT